MAQTDTRSGFKLPSAPDTTENDQAEVDAPSASTSDGSPTNEEPARQDMINSTTPAPARRPPTKLMADLTRAMQTAAEGARDETMARFLADSKTVIEEIQAASTEEAAALRRQADDDVAAVRDWSKAEVARIREETEARIAARKTALDGEIDAHAAVIETRVVQVGSRVEAYQAEMDEFFQRLLAESDPTRIATMAETMPDPPDLHGVAAAILAPTAEQFDPLQARLLTVVPDADAAPAPSPTEEAPTPTDDLAAEAEAAMAARLDFAAAEAEALAFTGDGDEDGATATTAPASTDHSAPIPAIASGLAHSDAGSLPSSIDTERTVTRVVVKGLVSVASIATFKRGLGRAEGVASVGVASGPDGEFVFTVAHDATARIGDTIMTLSGFEARITGKSTGTIEVTAHDPDTGD